MPLTYIGPDGKQSIPFTSVGEVEIYRKEATLKPTDHNGSNIHTVHTYHEIVEGLPGKRKDVILLLPEDAARLVGFRDDIYMPYGLNKENGTFKGIYR